MTDVDTTSPDLPRAGAQVAPLADELPMMVWLRGDEPFCGEFTLEADDVMMQLGIRRSRLTQISGKELRVGRMRKGRYVSPVYRQADVNAYLAWTRPTASHLKSSSVLKDAADALKKHNDELHDRLDALVPALSDALEHHARQLAFDAAKAAQEQTMRVEKALADSEAVVTGMLQRLQESERTLTTAIMRLTYRDDKLAAAQAVMAQDLAEIAGLLRIERESQKATATALDTTRAEVLAMIQQLQADRDVSTSETRTNLRVLTQSLVAMRTELLDQIMELLPKEQEPAPTPKPLRRRAETSRFRTLQRAARRCKPAT